MLPRTSHQVLTDSALRGLGPRSRYTTHRDPDRRSPAWHLRARRDRAHARVLLGLAWAADLLFSIFRSMHELQVCLSPHPSTDACITPASFMAPAQTTLTRAASGATDDVSRRISNYIAWDTELLQRLHNQCSGLLCPCDMQHPNNHRRNAGSQHHVYDSNHHYATSSRGYSSTSAISTF